MRRVGETEPSKVRHTSALARELIDILGEGEKLMVLTLENGGFELSYGKMYERPGLTFSDLKQLSDLFGTDNIDVDDYSRGGCDTCDFGSDYGHTIQLRQVTKRYEELRYLAGKDLMND